MALYRLQYGQCCSGMAKSSQVTTFFTKMVIMYISTSVVLMQCTMG